MVAFKSKAQAVVSAASSNGHYPTISEAIASQAVQFVNPEVQQYMQAKKLNVQKISISAIVEAGKRARDRVYAEKAEKIYRQQQKDRIHRIQKINVLNRFSGLGQFDWSTVISAGVTAASGIYTQQQAQKAALEKAKQDAKTAAAAAAAQQKAMESAAQQQANSATGKGWMNYLPYIGAGVAGLAVLYFVMKRK